MATHYNILSGLENSMDSIVQGSHKELDKIEQLSLSYHIQS